MIFRRVAAQPDGSGRRLSPAFLVSIGVHSLVAVALMKMLILDGDFRSEPKRAKADSEEHVGFVALPRPGLTTPTPGRSGGDGRSAKPREIRVVAPSAVPTTLPPPSTGVAKTPEDEGVGPLVGTGGPARGILPQYSDPRVWSPPGKIVAPPKTVAEAIDGLIAEAIAPYNDSVAAAAKKRDPTDWTIEKGGYKWGMDKRAIRLGPVSIPTALLALLPLNLQGNPTTMQRERSYAAMNQDIAWHARQAINEADFMKAVRSIRERKERERAAALAGSSAPKDEPDGDLRPRD
jgi:hypothetical protein